MNSEAASPSALLPDNLRAPAMTVGPVTPGSLDDQILAFPERMPPRKWYIALACTASVMTLGLVVIGYTLFTGIGAWGNNSPVFWAFDIINFVFWVGIGHAGTLISAILFIFRKRWRNAIARFAEAIVFGDLKDPASRVARLAASNRGHKVLEDLGTRPAITYLANLRNPAIEEQA